MAWAVSAVRNTLSQITHMHIQAAASGYTILASGGNELRDQNPHLFALYDKVQAVFVAMEGILACYEVGRFLEELCKTVTVINDATDAEQWIAILAGAAIIGGVVYVAYLVVSSVNEYFKGQNGQLQSQLENQIASALPRLQFASLEGPEMEFYQQGLYVVRIIATVALCILSVQNPLLCAVNVLCLGASLYKLSQQKWVQFTQHFPHLNLPVAGTAAFIRDVIGRYLFPLIPDRRQEQEECPICLETNSPPQNPKVYFCPDKSYHILCLPRLFFERSPQLLRGWHTTRTIHRTYDKYGNVTSETASYPSSIPRGNLPTCPDCRRNPVIDHQLYLSVNDSQKGYSPSGLVTLRE